MNKQTRLILSACLIAISLVAPALSPPSRAAARAAGAKQSTPAASPSRPGADTSQPARDERLWKKALEIQRKAIIVDGHNDITEIMVDEGYDLGTSSVGLHHTDLQRFKQSGLTGEFFSVYVDRKYASTDFAAKNYTTQGGSARRAMDLIDVVYRAAEKYPKDIIMASSTADIRRAKREGKLAALMGIEGGHAIENSLSVLRDFYRLGVRYMTLTHNNTNEWADACCDDARHNGLSEFGKEVVREMNRLGMFVDISHISDKTMSDVLDVATAPVMASHSSARALSNHRRNIPDELLKRIAKNGGVVMVNFYPVFIDEKVRVADKERDERLKSRRDELRAQFKDDPKRLADELKKLNDANPLPVTLLSVIIDHIDHIAKVAGVDHVGIGSDFDGVPFLPQGMEDIAHLPNITYELLRRGYSERDILKILGGNFMRAFAEVERVAHTQTRTVSGEGSQRRLEPAKR
ncbi:MAG: dipeptidase [Acidobacteria bacterium]|nr:dipeptidase [Acidobacteriota bacterium]